MAQLMILSNSRSNTSIITHINHTEFNQLITIHLSLITNTNFRNIRHFMGMITTTLDMIQNLDYLSIKRRDFSIIEILFLLLHKGTTILLWIIKDNREKTSLSCHIVISRIIDTLTRLKLIAKLMINI